jgi:hypothetical protein
VGEKSTVNDVLWPAFIVKGNVRPFKLNPLPLAAAAEMVRLDPPVLVSVSDKLVLLPTWTLPNARLVGFGVSAPCATPVPESGMLKLEFEPVEVMLTLPLAAPVAVGLKSTVNVVLWPAVNVKGKVSPLKLNPVPLAAAAEIVRLVPPVLVRVSVSDFEVPTWMLPKARLVEFAVRAPCVTPVPESGMLKLGFAPFEVTLTLPLAAPLAVGEKSTVKDVLWPAANVKGKVSPLKLNPVPLAAAAETVRLVPPVLVRVSDKLVLLPTWTLPKARLVGFGVSAPCATPVPDSGMLKLESEPVEVMLTLPLAAPLAVGLKSTVNVVLWPAVNVKGNDSPLKLNPVPLAAAAETVRLVPPELVSVADKLVLLPTWTLPNERLVGFAASAPGITPVPESGMLKLGFAPLEVMLTLPLAAPLAVGEKSTVNDVLWPAFIVKGNVRPFKLNPLPLAAAAEIVRLVPPELVSVSDKLVLLPTW